MSIFVAINTCLRNAVIVKSDAGWTVSPKYFTYLDSLVKHDVVKVGEPKRRPRKTTDSDFDAFWKAYPARNGIKSGKQLALKAWFKILPDDETIERIMSSVEFYKKTDSWTKENGQYIPMASTWLNQRRWEDEVVGAAPQTTQASGGIWNKKF